MRRRVGPPDLALRVSWRLRDAPLPRYHNIMKCQNILETIGNTPVVRLNHLEGHLAAGLWVKVESFNLLAILPDTGERYISTGLWSQ